MVSVENAVIARYKHAGSTFEVLVDCNLAIALKNSQEVDMKDVLADEKVFTDSKKGDIASPTALKQVFGIDNPVEVAKEIIKKGEIQLTAEYRNRLKEEKRKQIIATIHRNGVDPRTHAPHPITRIEAAFDEAKVHIDEYKQAEQQVSDIIKKLKVILPIRFETKQIEIVIPGKYTGPSYGILKSFGKMIKEEWQPDGNFVAVIEIPGGLEQEFYDKLNSITHGDNETKVIKQGE
jgi:ribosome maturation protein SDO1